MGILYLISVNLSKNIPYVGALYNIQCIYNVYVSWWQYPDPDHQISHAKYDVSHHHKTLQKVEPSTRELWSHHDHDDHHQGVMIPPWSIDHDDHHQGVMVPPWSWWPPSGSYGPTNLLERRQWVFFMAAAIPRFVYISKSINICCILHHLLPGPASGQDVCRCCSCLRLQLASLPSLLSPLLPFPPSECCFSSST